MAPSKKSKSKAADPAPAAASNKKGPRRNIVKSGNAGGSKSTTPDQQPSEKVTLETDKEHNLGTDIKCPLGVEVYLW